MYRFISLGFSKFHGLCYVQYDKTFQLIAALFIVTFTIVSECDLIFSYSKFPVIYNCYFFTLENIVKYFLLWKCGCKDPASFFLLLLASRSHPWRTHDRTAQHKRTQSHKGPSQHHSYLATSHKRTHHIKNHIKSSFKKK